MQMFAASKLLLVFLSHYQEHHQQECPWKERSCSNNTFHGGG